MRVKPWAKHRIPVPSPGPTPRYGRSAQQTTKTRQLPVADVPKNEYDDSNAAARPRFRPLGVCNPLTHVPKVPASVARPTTQSRPGGGATDPSRSRADGQIPSPLRGEGEDEGETPAPRRRQESNEMQPNATELKVSPLLATPDEANQGQRGLMLARCVGVSGVPNEATVAPFPASTVGVNEAKQGQIGPGFNPRPSFP